MARSSEGWKLHRDDRTGFQIVRFTHNGRRYNLSTRETDPRQAAIVAAQIYSDVVSGRRQKEVTPIRPARSSQPLDVLGAEWLAQIESSLDSTTVAQYGVYLRAHWMPFFGSLSRIDNGENYWRHRLRHVRRKTVLKELSALRNFLSWCQREGYLQEPPVITSPPKTATGTPDKNRRHKNRFIVFSEPEITSVISHLPEWMKAPRAPRPYPVRARFIVAWETALRPETLDRLRVPDDYKRGNRVLVIRDEIDKARFGRQLPLTERARAALDSVCPEIGLIFGKHDHRGALRAAAIKAALPLDKAERISPYDFRHSRLTNLAETSTNLAGIAYLAGHKHVTTTNRYVRPTERAAEQVLSANQAGFWSPSGHRELVQEVSGVENEEED